LHKEYEACKKEVTAAAFRKNQVELRKNEISRRLEEEK
jgi:hypothetical protein